jgi:hypothetical protein
MYAEGIEQPRMAMNTLPPGQQIASWHRTPPSRHVLATLCIVSAMHLWPHTIVSGQTGPTTNNPQVVSVVASKQGIWNTYFPDITRGKDSTLLVVFYSSPGHESDQGRIAMVHSSNQGRTWSSENVIVDTPLDDRDPSISHLKDGTLILNWFTRLSVPGGRLLRVNVARSTDNGESWSEPVVLQTPFSNVACSDKALELSDGSLIIPLYGFDAGGYSAAALVRSVDGGRTWPGASLRVIALDPSRRVMYYEPALVELEPGHVLCLLRTNVGDSFENHSYDGGEHWGTPARLTIKAHASNLLLCDNQFLVHCYGDVSGTFGAGRNVVMLVTPVGTEWPTGTQRLIYFAGQMDAAYPSSILLDKNTVLTVFYDAAKGFVGSVSTPLRDVVGTITGAGAVPTATGISAFPNPFNSVTHIALRLPSAAPAPEARVFDPLGREIATLRSATTWGTTFNFTWDGRTGDGGGAPSGVYYVQCGSHSSVVKLLLLR